MKTIIPKDYKGYIWKIKGRIGFSKDGEHLCLIKRKMNEYRLR